MELLNQAELANPLHSLYIYHSNPIEKEVAGDKDRERERERSATQYSEVPINLQQWPANASSIGLTKFVGKHYIYTFRSDLEA